MKKELKINALVWTWVDVIPMKCVVVSKFESNNQYHLVVAGTNKSIIVSPDECYDTEELCESNHDSEIARKKTYYSSLFKNHAELFAFLFNSIFDNKKVDDIALMAAMKEADEMTGISILDYMVENYGDEFKDKERICGV